MSEESALLPVDLASERDLPSILRLAATEYQPPVTSEAHWRWRYFDNPVAKAAVYVARNDAGAVVAMQPVSEYSMIARGTRRRVQLLTGAITHRDYRRRGLFREIINRIEKDLGQQGDFFMYTFPNEMSAKGFRGFAGWHQRELLTLYVRPLSLWNLRKHDVELPAMTASSCSMSNDQRADLTLKEIDSFDMETDELLRRALGPDAMYIHRSRKYLNWRYTSNPTAEYIIHTAEKDGKLDGYVVFRPKLLFGVRAGLIADLVASDRRVAFCLLRRAIRSARARQLSLLVLLCGSHNPNLSSLYANGFLRVPRHLLPRQFYLFVNARHETGSHPLEAIAASPWLVTWGDIDVI